MASQGEFDPLIDLIYEAAVVPEKWPELLGRLSSMMEGAGGILFTANASGMRWTASPDIWPVFDEFLREGWHAINPRPPRIGSLNHAGFVLDSDVFTPEEIDRDPVYTDFLRPRGGGWALGTMCQVPSGDALIFSFEKDYRKGLIEHKWIAVFDVLRPHLARAALLGAHFGLERARAMADALEACGLPTAVLRGRGKLYATNPRFDAMMPGLAHDGPLRLTLEDAEADRLLSEGLDALGATPATGRVFSIPVPPRREGQVPVILHLVPVRRAAHDVLNSASALLVATCVDRAAVPAAEIVAGLFDLTPAEARIARQIAAGVSVEAIAAEHGLSRETVRTHLRQVFAKVGVRRQAELAALLGGLLLPRGG